MYLYVYKNPTGNLLMSTLSDTPIGCMRQYLHVSIAVETALVIDRFEAAIARGGRIVEVEIRETGR